MISREIEKEIQQENKVILNFTMRQVVCLSVALAFGWMKQDGIPMERILKRKLQVYLYKNNVRVYKTKNRYVVMMNREYDRRRMVDSGDKKLKKSVRKDAKRKKKELRRSKLKRIA